MPRRPRKDTTTSPGAGNGTPPTAATGRRPWWRDPFVVFLAIGALLFALDWLRGDGAEDKEIFVSRTEVARLADLWEAQSGRPPSADELEGLVQATVREEVLFREAVRLGLDQDDTIIRRRLAQKMGFLIDDNTRIPEPSPSELSAWFAARRERYEEPSRWSFRHVFYSVDRRGEQSAREQASSDLRLLGAGGDGWRALGDPFMLQREYAARTAQDVAELFGRRFATALLEQQVSSAGRWFGPVVSALGLHLVQIREFVPQRQRSLEEARTQVLEDYRREQRERANDDAFRELRARYVVEIDLPGSGSEDSLEEVGDVPAASTAEPTATGTVR